MSNKYIVEVWLDKDGGTKTKRPWKMDPPGRPETITVPDPWRHNYRDHHRKPRSATSMSDQHIWTVGSPPPTT